MNMGSVDRCPCSRSNTHEHKREHGCLSSSPVFMACEHVAVVSNRVIYLKSKTMLEECAVSFVTLVEFDAVKCCESALTSWCVVCARSDS